MSGVTTKSSAEREGFRAFEEASPEVRTFYHDNHTLQTLAFVRAMEPRLERFLAVRREWDPNGRLRSAQSVRVLGDRP